LSYTYTPTGTSTSTLTQVPSATFSETPTSTPTLLWTATPTATFTLTLTTVPSPTETESATITPTGIAVSTATPTPTPLPNDQVPLFWPNPVNGSSNVNLWVSFSQPHDYLTVKIYTTAYRKIYQRTWNYVQARSYSLTLDDLKVLAMGNGLYYAVVTTPSDKWLKKLLILK
jgi:hypothetical protein